MTFALDPALVTELAAQVSGPLLGPGDDLGTLGAVGP